MNIIRKTLLMSVAALSISTMPVYAAIDNPVTQAVIRVYDQQLRANPEDYMTWFRRANEYYQHNEYTQALEDINQALRFAPGNDSDFRFQALMIRAGIYNQTGRYEMALADLNSAIALDNSSMAAYNQRANTNYALGRYADAKTDYTILQRFNMRSPEALLGLARCAIKENNLSAASDYLEQAVSFAPNNPEVYTRRASVRQLMGDHNGAVEDLIIALSINANDPKAIASLVEYGNTNYPAVIAGLTNAINLAPQNGLYRYLRASIAQAHFNYLSAIDDFQYIIDQRLYNHHGLYASVARCMLGLGRYQEALGNIDAALGETTNIPEYYTLRSQILRALDRKNDAIDAAARALAVDRSYIPGLVEMSLNYIDKGEYDQAVGLLGEASMIDANDPSVYMLRAWLLETYLNQPSAANQFYEMALSVEGYTDDDVRSLRGFALLNLKKYDEADAWMEHILSQPDNDGLNNYYGACYYMLREDDEKSLQCVENSLKAGYSDNHNWMMNTDGQINAGVLRDDLRFLRLMQKYNFIFGK